MPIGLIVESGPPTHNSAAQHALAPDAAPLRFAAQVKRKPLGGTTGSVSVINDAQNRADMPCEERE